MTAGTTNLILSVHGHQPIGNFNWVFGEAYAKAYEPFLNVIERHPVIKWTVHYSGPLVEWLEAERPALLRRIAALVKRGQLEVMSGGYAEPAFCLIPERDAIGQIRRFTRRLGRLALGPCRGAWLTERVWEPSLPRLFRAAGIEYTIVDDHHLACAGVRPEAQVGYWVTEDAGATLALFPSSKPLRYLVPFKPVEAVIEHLRALRSPHGHAVVLADDLEKFGLWPGTFRWVYEEGWLERFCQALEAERAWLKTYTCSRFLEAYPPVGRVYVPCASYEEMSQWSGGHFRNFLTKYPEANTMHKKMLWVSHRVDMARRQVRDRRVREAETRLYRGQGNDAYWHGVFGGIYLNHLRAATYRELLTAERLLDRVANGTHPWVTSEATDLDGDGEPEVLLRSGLMDLWIDPQRGGAIVEWDDKRRAINIVNTLTRRPEPYHARLLAPEGPTQPPEAPTAEGAAADRHPETIHVDVRVKEPDLRDHLIYDRYRRVAAIDHLWPPGAGDAQAFARSQLPGSGDLVEQRYRWRVERRPDGARVVLARDGQVEQAGRAVPLRITKAITLARRHPTVYVEYTLLNRGPAPLPVRFGSEWNLALKDPHFNRIGALQGTRRLIVTDSQADVSVELTTSVLAACWYFPIETVSDSEGGLERTYQQVNLTLVWDVVATPRRPWRVVLTHTVRSGGVDAPM